MREWEKKKGVDIRVVTETLTILNTAAQTYFSGCYSIPAVVKFGLGETQDKVVLYTEILAILNLY